MYFQHFEMGTKLHHGQAAVHVDVFHSPKYYFLWEIVIFVAMVRRLYCFDSCLTSVRCAITHLAFALINWMKKEAVATKSLLRLLALGNKLHSVLISLYCYTNMSHKQSKASTFQFLHFTAELVSGFCPGTKDKHGYSSRPMLNSCKRAFQKDVFP